MSDPTEPSNLDGTVHKRQLMTNHSALVNLIHTLKITSVVTLSDGSIVIGYSNGQVLTVLSSL